MAMKLNIDENIVKRCGSGAALLFLGLLLIQRAFKTLI
jgi:hypothetical protein